MTQISLIQKLLHHLHKHQNEDGSFSSFSSANGVFSKSATVTTSAIFPSALILGILAKQPNVKQLPEANGIMDQLAQFLVSQKSDYWTFNYWKRHAIENKELPYPDDVDDTSCALASLALYDSSLLDGNDLAKIVTSLTVVEQQEGGPYHTWFVNEQAEAAWRDIDVLVNSNVAYMLSIWELDVPNLTQYINEAISNDTLTSQYYVDQPLYGIYTIARWYKGAYTQQLVDAIHQELSTQKTVNDMAYAMAASALYYLDRADEAAPLIATIQKWSVKRIWKPQPYVIEYKAIAGSPALTASFVIEALSLADNDNIKHSITEDTALMNATSNSAEYKNQSARIYQQTINTLIETAPHMEQPIRSVITTLQEKDHQLDEIALIARFTAESLTSNIELSEQLLDTLGSLNILGWAAYSIYDDIVDEQTHTDILPVANVAMRQGITMAQEIETDIPGITNLLNETLTTADQALLWERNNCYQSLDDKHSITLPNYDNGNQLVQRSFGHALGALAVMQLLGYSPDSTEYGYCTAFFTHYLIARQLLDDMHDWEEDLDQNYINSVSTNILKFWLNEESAFSQWYPTDGTREQQLQHVFWFDVAEPMCNTIQDHLAQAKIALEQLTTKEHTPLHNVLQRLEQAIKTTQKERSSSIAFLESYHRINP